MIRGGVLCVPSRHLALLSGAAYAMTMFDARVNRAFSPLVEGIAAPMARRGSSALNVTIGGFVAAVAAIVFITSGFYLTGYVLLLLNRLADGVDGAVARRTEPTPVGEFLDTLLDFVVIAAVPFAFSLAHPASALAGAFLLLGIVVWAVSELSLRLTHGPTDAQTYNTAGHKLPASICGYTETFIVFGLMCLVPVVFPVLCYLYGILLFVSVGIRVAGAVMSAENFQR